jgi:broad specificity phosphatase PhoE
MDVLRIYLIRHHKPKVIRTGQFSYAQAMRFLLDYDTADIEALHEKPIDLPYHVQKVYCSQLNRSRQTAWLLFGPQTKLVEDPRFNEFEQKVLHLPLITLPIGVWLTLSRILWIAGLWSGTIESFRAARIRAGQCASILATAAQQEKETVLVAHGFLNFFIRRALKKMNWQVVKKGGNDYLGVTVLEKQVQA